MRNMAYNQNGKKINKQKLKLTFYSNKEKNRNLKKAFD